MKPQWKRVWTDVRRILHADWDPIGAPTPEDEYDCCAGPVVSMLFQKASQADIADFLEAEATGHFGCPMPRDVHDRVAEKLSAVSLPHD
jgi:hypothetical protein